jgi:hypothetical protein
MSNAGGGGEVILIGTREGKFQIISTIRVLHRGR